MKKFLDLNGCWYVKFFANAYTKKGIPDLLCCINGHFVAIELKAENGRTSDLQKFHIEKIKNSGGYGLILKPSGFEEFKKLILELKER